MVNGVVFALWWLQAGCGACRNTRARKTGKVLNITKTSPFAQHSKAGTLFPVYDFIVTRKKSKNVSAVRLIFKVYSIDRLKTPVFK